MKKYSNKRLLAILLAFAMTTSVNAEANIIIKNSLSNTEFSKRNFSDFEGLIKLDDKSINKELTTEDIIYLGYAYNNLVNIWLGAKYSNKFLNSDDKKLPEEKRIELEKYYEEMYLRLEDAIYPYLENMYRHLEKNSDYYYYEHDIYANDTYYYNREDFDIGVSRVIENIELPSYGKGAAEVTISNYENVPTSFRNYYIYVNMYNFKPYDVYNFYDGDMTVKTKYANVTESEIVYSPKSIIEDKILPEDISKNNSEILSYKGSKEKQPVGRLTILKVNKNNKREKYVDSKENLYKNPNISNYPLGALKKRGGLRR